MAKILLIEDDQALAGMYEMKFREEGYEIDVAGDGEEGLERIRSNRPDLVLLDIVLPKKDGYQVLEEIRNDEQIKDVQVFVLSNLGQNGEIEQGKNKGADDYFVKASLTPTQLVEKVKERLKGE